MHLDEFLRIKGKNLFDKNNRTRIYGYFASTGTTWTYNASAYSNKIPCKPNTTYTARYNGNSTQAVLGFGSCSTDAEPTASENVKVTQGIRQNSPTLNTPVTITTGANDKWLIVAYNVAEPQHTDMANNLQIEEGSTATAYEPYKGEFKMIGDIWQRAVPTPTAKSNPIQFKPTRVAKNLVDFNETRITSSTWAAADKTKGFEIVADIYGKSVGGSLGTNGNCFGVFVPCKKGESVSLDFFNYEPYYGRCFYCEVDTDFKVLTTPVQYSNGTSALTQKTFTATDDNCIGFAIEWYISAAQTRNYTKENYMVVRGTTVPTAYYPYFAPTTVMPSLKAFGATPVKRKQEKLWSRFVPVEYIESSGTQWIDTGVKGNLNTKAELTYKVINAATPTYTLFGATDGGDNNNSFFVRRSANGTATYANLDTKARTVIVQGVNDTNKHTTVLSKDGWYIDDTLCATWEDPSDFTTPDNILICNVSGVTAGNNPVSADIYGCKLWDNGTLVRDLVPVKDVVNNVYGMFDRVTETFYGNAGTGAFTGGELIQPISYAESDGTAWADTEIVPTVAKETDILLKISANAVEANGFGANRNLNIETQSSNTVWRANGATTTASRVANEIIDVELKQTSSGRYYKLKTVEGYGSNNEDTFSFYLGKLNGGSAHIFKGRYYSAVIKENNALVRDYLPVRIGTTVELLDLVNWQFATRTGTFTAGTDIPYSQLCPEIIKVNTGDMWYGYSDGVVLPSEYERVSYTSMTNKGLIETSLPILKETDVIEFDFLFKSKSNQPVFGCNNGAQTFGLWIYNNKLTANSGGNGYAEITLTDAMINNPLHYKYEGTQLTITGNGVSITKTIGQLAPASDKTYKIFGSSLPNSYTIAADAYRFTVNGRMDLIPVKKTSNSEYGFYDLITGSFFGNNAGTGSLIGGTVIPRSIHTDGSHKIFAGSQGVVDMGTLNWQYITAWTHPAFRCTGSDLPNAKVGNMEFYFTDQTYTKVAPQPSWEAVANQGDKVIGTVSVNYSGIVIRDDRFTDLTSFKASLSGKYLFYQRTTDTSFIQPEVRDVPMLLSADSFVDTQLDSNNKSEAWTVKVLDGTENWNPFMNGFYTQLAGLKSMTTDRLGFCTHYLFSDGTGGAPNGTFIYNASPTNGNVSFRDDSIGTDVDDWKAFLASEYAKGTPVIIAYPLATLEVTTIAIAPVELTEKATYTVASEAELPVTVQATYLGK